MLFSRSRIQKSTRLRKIGKHLVIFAPSQRNVQEGPVFLALLHLCPPSEKACRDAHSPLSALAEENLRCPEDDETYAEFPQAPVARIGGRGIGLHPPKEAAAFVTKRFRTREENSPVRPRSSHSPEQSSCPGSDEQIHCGQEEKNSARKRPSGIAELRINAAASHLVGAGCRPHRLSAAPARRAAGYPR